MCFLYLIKNQDTSRMLSHESRYIAFLASFINAICPGEFNDCILIRIFTHIKSGKRTLQCFRHYLRQKSFADTRCTDKQKRSRGFSPGWDCHRQ